MAKTIPIRLLFNYRQIFLCGVSLVFCLSCSPCHISAQPQHSVKEPKKKAERIRLELGPVLMKTDVANVEIAFADLNEDGKPDMVLGSQWHIFDESNSKVKKTKMSKDGRPISIHVNKSTKRKIEFGKPVWPVPNDDVAYKLPGG